MHMYVYYVYTYFRTSSVMNLRDKGDVCQCVLYEPSMQPGALAAPARHNDDNNNNNNNNTNNDHTNDHTYMYMCVDTN